MTGLELALLGGTIGKLVGTGTQSLSTLGQANDLRLTPEQKRRLKDLERLAARDEFGMTEGEREIFRTRAMNPVQTAEREALARFRASQNIADIGQGSTFRQQQALKQTSEAARAQIAQAEAQRDAEIARQQQLERDRLLQQQRQASALERQAALQLIGGLGETVSEGLSVVGEKKMMDEMYDRKIKQMKESGQETASQVAKMLGIEGIGESSGKSLQTQAVENLSASGTDALGQNSVDFVEQMKKKPSFENQEGLNIVDLILNGYNSAPNMGIDFWMNSEFEENKDRLTPEQQQIIENYVRLQLSSQE